MSKPDDIPQDVWDRAAMLWGHEARIGIARAIMAERERCAAAAEQRGKELREPAIGSDIGNTIRGRF